MIIAETIADGNSSLQTQEEQFIAKLDAEKEQFLKDLANYKQTFRRIEGFKDINTLNDFFKEASTLKKLLDDSKDQVETFNMREGRLGQPKSVYEDFDELCTSFLPFF